MASQGHMLDYSMGIVSEVLDAQGQTLGREDNNPAFNASIGGHRVLVYPTMDCVDEVTGAMQVDLRRADNVLPYNDKDFRWLVVVGLAANGRSYKTRHTWWIDMARLVERGHVFTADNPQRILEPVFQVAPPRRTATQ